MFLFVILGYLDQALQTQSPELLFLTNYYCSIGYSSLGVVFVSFTVCRERV